MFRFLYFIAWPFVRLFFPTGVVKKTKLTNKDNYIYICNHRSNFDVILLCGYIYKKKYILAKKELFKKKCTAKFLRMVGAIEVDRNNLDLSAIKTCLSLLKNNKSLLIFPEGTRKDATEIDDIKSGAAMLSIKSRTKIVPIYIKKKPKLFRFNKMIIGEPFELNDYYESKATKEILSEASLIIEKKLNELKE